MSLLRAYIAGWLLLAIIALSFSAGMIFAGLMAQAMSKAMVP